MPSDNTAPTFLSEINKEKKKKPIKGSMRDKERVRFHYLSKVLDTSVSYLYSVKKNKCIFEKTRYNET